MINNKKKMGRSNSLTYNSLLESKIRRITRNILQESSNIFIDDLRRQEIKKCEQSVNSLLNDVDVKCDNIKNIATEILSKSNLAHGLPQIIDYGINENKLWVRFEILLMFKDGMYIAKDNKTQLNKSHVEQLVKVLNKQLTQVAQKDDFNLTVEPITKVPNVYMVKIHITLTKLR